MKKKTPLQQLIERLKKSIEARPSDYSDGYKEGINAAILEAESLLQEEREQLITDPQFKEYEHVYVRNADDEPWVHAIFLETRYYFGDPCHYVIIEGCPECEDEGFNQIKKR